MQAIEFPEEIKKQAIVSSLTRGDILIWEKFQFKDGTTKDKLVLIISECIEKTYYVIALPTSKIDGYIDGRRPLVDTVCFPKNTETCFNLDTVIDLKNLTDVRADELAQGLGKHVTFSRRALSSAGLTQIMGAVEKAHTLTPKQKELILRGWTKS